MYEDRFRCLGRHFIPRRVYLVDLCVVNSKRGSNCACTGSGPLAGSGWASTWFRSLRLQHPAGVAIQPLESRTLMTLGITPAPLPAFSRRFGICLEERPPLGAA